MIPALDRVNGHIWPAEPRLQLVRCPEDIPRSLNYQDGKIETAKMLGSQLVELPGRVQRIAEQDEPGHT